MGYIYLLCLVAIPSCLGGDLLSNSWFGDVGDIDNYVERPCPDLDLDCIRRYFTQNSNCVKANGQVADPYFLELISVRLASPNTTVVAHDAVITGLNGRVSEFTINRKTNNLVIVIETRDVIFSSPRADFRYQRQRKDSIVLSDKLIVFYGTVIYTVVFPDLNNLDLTEMEIFPYVANGDIPYAFGPGVIQTFDMEAIRSFNAFVFDIPAVAKEAFEIRAPVFASVFIQTTICNFGVTIEAS